MLTLMKIRFPDMPTRIAQCQLKDFEILGGFIATIKVDGWRVIIDWTGEDLEFYSRRRIDKGGPTILPVNISLREEAKQFFIHNKIPSNSRLDGEWMGRRTEGPEKIVLFGIQYYNGEWIGSEPERVRWNLVESFKFNQENVLKAESSEENYCGFFKSTAEQMHLPENERTTEGIVLKHEDSTLIGNVKTSKDNPGWFKAKWRDGASGHDTNTY
jgi:ATP-dependent DNA ligase